MVDPKGDNDAADVVDGTRPWHARRLDGLTPPRLAMTAALAAALLLLFVSLAGPRHEQTPEGIAHIDLEIAEDLELYEDYDVIRDLDVLDDLEVIEEEMDEG